jgi:hypothetical protein
MEKRAKKFRSFSEAEKADRDFYKKLTGNERLQFLVELLNHGLEHPAPWTFSSGLLQTTRGYFSHC